MCPWVVCGARVEAGLTGLASLLSLTCDSPQRRKDASRFKVFSQGSFGVGLWNGLSLR